MANQSTPANQLSGLTTIDYVVAEMLNELEDYSTIQKQRLIGLVISALRDIRLYHKSSTQVAYLTINEAGIIPYPHDYVDYINIGIPINGQLWDLTQDKKMLLDRATKCGTDSRVMNEYFAVDQPVRFWSPIWQGNKFVPTYYGIGGGYNTAYYKLDDEARQIQFDGRIPHGEVVLVYKSTGVSVNTVIPFEMIKPLKQIAHYNRVKFNMVIPMNHKQLLKKDMEESIMELRAFVQKFTISEYLDVLFRYKKQTGKP